MERCIIPFCSLESMIDVDFKQNLKPQIFVSTGGSRLFSCNSTKMEYRGAKLTLNAFLIWS